MMVIMYFVKIYFIFGLAMLFVVLWNYKYLPKTANRLVKQPGDKSGFFLIALAVRNLLLMTLLSFFFWTPVVVMDLSRTGKK